MSDRKDLTGQRFGRLTAKYTFNKTSGARSRTYWHCVCDCGNEKDVLTDSLTSGRTLSCGCLCRERTSATSCYDLTGKRIGRLTVLKRVSEIGAPKVLWLCKCDCGNEKVIKADALNSNKTISCGCYQRDVIKARDTKHGLRRTRIYGIYHDMRKRCYNKKAIGYKNYGGRGIKICDDWIGDDGFLKFYDWSMENGYSDDLSIDRIDVNGNYEPSNCRWANKLTQANNTRSNIKFMHRGKMMNVSEIARSEGIEYTMLYSRIVVGKWKVDDAVMYLRGMKNDNKIG